MDAPVGTESQLDRIERNLATVARTLATLVAALAEDTDDGDEPEHSLDGTAIRQRDSSQSLD